MPGYVTNLINRSTTQITGLDFDSYCQFNSKPIAVGDGGLYELCGDTDDGTSIDAHFETPIIDFGSQKDKRLRFIYIGFESDGDLLISVSVDGGAYREYDVVPKKVGRQRIRVPVGRDGHGRYWQFKISNKNGSFFAVDHLSVLVNERHEGIS